MAERTIVVLGRGNVIFVEKPFQEMAELYAEALANSRALWIGPPDGDEIVINPFQVQSLRPDDG